VPWPREKAVQCHKILEEGQKLDKRVWSKRMYLPMFTTPLDVDVRKMYTPLYRTICSGG
jgi:hypothetical protein